MKRQMVAHADVVQGGEVLGNDDAVRLGQPRIERTSLHGGTTLIGVVEAGRVDGDEEDDAVAERDMLEEYGKGGLDVGQGGDLAAQVVGHRQRGASAADRAVCG